MGWLVLDPCGLICATFCYCLIFAADWGMFNLLDMTTGYGLIAFAMLNFFLGMAVWSHWVAMTTDPGGTMQCHVSMTHTVLS